MRILDKSNLALDLTKLGFEPGALETFMRAISLPYGMVLVTGPTGSGKTTTLYSALIEGQHLGSEHHDGRGPGGVQPGRESTRSISTSDVKLTFAAALRSVPPPGPEHHHGG